jgi:hypothetical protein
MLNNQAMSFLSLVQNALIASVGGFRPILRGFSPGAQDDDVATVGQVNALQPPVPFSVSVSLEQDFSGSISGLITILPETVEVPLATIGTGEGQISGFNFYVDTQRGSYWGDLTVTINQSGVFTSEAVLPVMDTSQCNSIVQTDISGEPEEGESYFVSITVSGGGHSITRTFTLNIEEGE